MDYKISESREVFSFNPSSHSLRFPGSYSDRNFCLDLITHLEALEIRSTSLFPPKSSHFK